MITCDKHGREIKIGDILKVYHFTGARQEKYYMYKQVIGERLLGGLGGKPKVPYFDVSEGIKQDYEILQGLDDIEERPKFQQE